MGSGGCVAGGSSGWGTGGQMRDEHTAGVIGVFVFLKLFCSNIFSVEHGVQCSNVVQLVYVRHVHGEQSIVLTRMLFIYPSSICRISLQRRSNYNSFKVSSKSWPSG